MISLTFFAINFIFQRIHLVYSNLKVDKIDLKIVVLSPSIMITIYQNIVI